MFDPVIHLEVLGPKLCDRPVVEQPVTNVISAFETDRRTAYSMLAMESYSKVIQTPLAI